MTRHRFMAVGLILALCLMTLPFKATHAATEITFWHAMTGTNQKVLQGLVADFNSSQSDIHVTEQNKGADYPTVLNNVIAAEQQKQGPNIAQIFDLGTPLAIDSGFFIPMQSLLSADQLAAIRAD